MDTAGVLHTSLIVYRKADNASGSNMIVIDFDGDTRIRAFWATDTAQQWCAATYTSASHTKEEHRFRAIFPLEKELSSAAEHRGAYWLDCQSFAS